MALDFGLDLGDFAPIIPIHQIMVTMTRIVGQWVTLMFRTLQAPLELKH